MSTGTPGIGADFRDARMKRLTKLAVHLRGYEGIDRRALSSPMPNMSGFM
jgi:hypothetical protein